MSKYDLEAIREVIIDRKYDPKYRCYYDEEDDPDGEYCAYFVRQLTRVIPVWEHLAKDLYKVLDERYRAVGIIDHTVGDERSQWVRYGDSEDLYEDKCYSWGNCNMPNLNIEIREAYIQLWHPRQEWPVWVFFDANGVDVCQTSRQQKGMIFAAKPFLKWGWENPNLWRELATTLAGLGFPVEWTPDAEVLA